jgi:hypothetical protein
VDTTTPDDLAADILHGAQAIADYIGVDLRRAFYLLQHGYIPAVKTGTTWTSTCGATLMTSNKTHGGNWRR